MILEVAPLQIRLGQEAAFEAAFLEAQRIIASMPGYVSHELQRCIERPHEYVLLVRWQSLEAHEVGFRVLGFHELSLHHLAAGELLLEVGVEGDLRAEVDELFVRGRGARGEDAVSADLMLEALDLPADPCSQFHRGAHSAVMRRAEV